MEEQGFLRDLLAKGALVNKDLIVNDDNGYYRGLIVPSAREPGIIKLALGGVYSFRFDPEHGEIRTAIDLAYFCVGLDTTYRETEGDIITFELSVSGCACITAHNAPMPNCI